MKEEIFRLERVTQIIEGVTLLDNFSVHIFKGEIMGLVCFNAHGKEALIRLLCQNTPINYGHVYFQENLVNNYEHSSMTVNPVAVIEKQSRLVEDLTVADNIFVMRRGFRKYLIDPRVLNAQFRQFAQELDIQIDGAELISHLSFFEKCVVEIIKAVVARVKLIVIRDISNFISTTDLKKIHDIMRHYRMQDISFLYICNHHEEAFKICDRISLMENGKVLKILNTNEFKDEMIGPYTLDFSHINSPTLPNGSKSGILKFQNVSTENIIDMSFSIEKGECVVFLDMNNTVLTDMMKLMQGETKPLSGDVFLDGCNYIKKLSELKKGVCFIQENPIQSMLFQERSYIDNLSFLVDKKLPHWWLNKNIRKSIIQEYEPLVGEDIHTNDISSLTPMSLYNLVYYRVHLYNPKVVFCMQPFSDADMYLRHHLIQLINQLRKKNITVIILAVSISDSLVVADRLMVVEQGKLKNEYHSEKFHSFRASQ
jgi:ribose transport system ATP-binding protein